MPRFIYSQLDINQYNFRVWKNPVETAIQGTRCAVNGLGNRFDAVDNDSVNSTVV